MIKIAALLATSLVVMTNMFAQETLAKTVKADFTNGKKPIQKIDMDDEDILKAYFSERKYDGMEWVYNEDYVPKKKRYLQLVEE